MKNKFYVTTPIYYVNDSPHIGSTCTTLVADILNRYHQLKGEDTFFLTGTDEHGAKVAEAAAGANKTPLEFCDQVSQRYIEAWPSLNIKYDYFIRTTNPEHKKIVQEILTKIYENGDIYKGKYDGLYCIGCEKFITETELVDGKCPLHPNREVVHQSEENYFFRLSTYVPKLIKAIEDDNDPLHYEIYPDNKKREILSRLKAGVNDLSVSRAQVSWGIPIPWDKQQTIYVWVEALFNYYTALRINDRLSFWPADVHVVGKEISWFHCVIWEALLMSAGIKLPKKIFVHSFYNIDGQKMSKSLGNVITPQQMVDRYGVDGARYLIASSFPAFEDSDVGFKKFSEKYNADLANGLGNLVARVLSLVEKYCGGKVPNIDNDPETHPLRVNNQIYNWKKTWADYDKSLNEFRFAEALEAIWRFIGEANKYINEQKPWELAEKNKKEFGWVIYGLLDAIHQIAWQIYPFMPGTAILIARSLGIEKLLIPNPLNKDSWVNIKSRVKIKPHSALFPRLIDK